MAADPPSGARQHRAAGARPTPVAGRRPAAALAGLAIDKPRRCLPSSGQRPRAWHDLSARRTGQEGVTRMRYRFVVGSLGLALAAALTTPALGQDPGLLLRGQPGGLQPAALHRRHHLRCQLARRSTTAWSSSSTARPSSGPALAESWEISDDGLRIHLPSAPGRQVPDHRRLHPDPRSQRRRRGLQLRAPVAAGSSLPQRLGRLLRVLHQRWPARPAEVDREGRRPDRASFTLQRAERDVRRRSWPWTSPRSSRPSTPIR